MQRGVGSLELQQLGVRAGLQHAARAQHAHAVGAAHRAQAVGDHDARAARARALQRLRYYLTR